MKIVRNQDLSFSYLVPPEVLLSMGQGEAQSEDDENGAPPPLRHRPPPTQTDTLQSIITSIVDLRVHLDGGSTRSAPAWMGTTPILTTLTRKSAISTATLAGLATWKRMLHEDLCFPCSWF